VKRFLQHYGVLGLSLLALFASGVGIGRYAAPKPQPVTQPVVETSASSEAWVAAASRGLVRDLQLDASQELKVRQHLEPVAVAIYTDQERALFQMHLRLLELHDTLAKQVSLDARQLGHLAASRAKLKDLIIRKFPRSVRANPSLAIGNQSN
jgi:transposase